MFLLEVINNFTYVSYNEWKSNMHGRKFDIYLSFKEEWSYSFTFDVGDILHTYIFVLSVSRSKDLAFAIYAFK